MSSKAWRDSWHTASIGDSSVAWLRAADLARAEAAAAGG
jgi:hypothetical protein